MQQRTISYRAKEGYAAVSNARSTGIRPLSVWKKCYNNLMGRSRDKIERVFGSIKRWFGRLEAKYIGMAKTHGQYVKGAIRKLNT